MEAAGIFGRCVTGVTQMSKGRSLLAVTATRAKQSASRQVHAGKREILIEWRRAYRRQDLPYQHGRCDSRASMDDLVRSHTLYKHAE